MVQLLGKAIVQIFLMDGRAWVFMCAMENYVSLPLGTIMQDCSFFVLLCMQRLGLYWNIILVVFNEHYHADVQSRNLVNVI